MTKEKIDQFVPPLNGKKLPWGTFGWGFEKEINGKTYKFLMYLPKDMWSNEAYTATDERIEYKRKTLERRLKKSAREIGVSYTVKIDNDHEIDSIKNNREHGPCHVHVICESDNRETRFELIEGAKVNIVRYCPLQRRSVGNNRTCPKDIHQPVMNQIAGIISEHSSEFIQLWREGYGLKDEPYYKGSRLDIYPLREEGSKNKSWLKSKQQDSHTR